MTTKNKREQLAKLALGFGGWVSFQEGFLAFLKADEAVFLSRLMMHSNWEKYRVQEANLDWNGWFPLDTEEIEKCLHMDTDQQIQILKRLRKLRLISEEMWEDSPIEYHIRINFNRLAKLILNS